MVVYLYKITRLATGQSYIGVTVNPRKREATHKWIANKRHRGLFQLIHKAIAKYGCDAFSFEVIACSRNYESALQTEIDLIAQWQSHISDSGYNLTRGGEGPSGRSCTPETRASAFRRWRDNPRASSS